jgi:hypothetical protein
MRFFITPTGKMKFKDLREKWTRSELDFKPQSLELSPWLLR